MAEIFHINYYTHIENNTKITKEKYDKLCSKRKKKYIASLTYNGPYYLYSSDNIKLSKEEQEQIQKGFAKVKASPEIMYVAGYNTKAINTNSTENIE